MAGNFSSGSFSSAVGGFSVDSDGRSKSYSIDGIPIPFTDDAYDAAAARRHEIRRQQMHEDQLAIDIVVQAVTSRIIK